MGRTNEYQTETSPFDGSQKDAEMAPEKKIFCDIFMDGTDSFGLIRESSQMIEKLMTMLVGILLALAGWSLTRTFELSTQQAVVLDKVDKLERVVEKLEDKMDRMMDSDEEIMEQHELLFKKLEQGNTGYSYN